MTYLLDTNAFSELMREHPKLRAKVSGLSPSDQLIVCTIVHGEIDYGISRLPTGQRKQDLQAKAMRLFAGLRCEPVSETAAQHYADIKIARERLGLALDENDLWIAAVCRDLNVTLVSHDQSFRQIPGLNVEDWVV